MDRSRRLTRSLSQQSHQTQPAIKHSFSIRPQPHQQQRKLRRNDNTNTDNYNPNKLKLNIKPGDAHDDDAAASEKDSQYSRPMKALEEADAAAALVSNKAASASALDLHFGGDTSLVPDFLPVQPIQAIPDPSAPTFRSKYNLYNPAGPRWYYNVHLTPPHTRIPLASTFSPSFPPIHAANVAGSPIDVGLVPGSARTPSGSPQPTPNASQTRLAAGQQDIPAPHAIPARARKISLQNANLLDASDPLGMNWHNPSPYDVGADALNSATQQAHDVRFF